MRPDIAVYITAGYLVLVAIGYSLRPSNWKTLAAEPSSGYKGLNLAVMLFKDPVRFLQVVYNTVQIVLCSYMVSGAGLGCEHCVENRRNSVAHTFTRHRRPKQLPARVHSRPPPPPCSPCPPFPPCPLLCVRRCTAPSLRSYGEE